MLPAPRLMPPWLANPVLNGVPPGKPLNTPARPEPTFCTPESSAPAFDHPDNPEPKFPNPDSPPMPLLKKPDEGSAVVFPKPGSGFTSMPHRAPGPMLPSMGRSSVVPPPPTAKLRGVELIWICPTLIGPNEVRLRA